jgi:hypothetical protein
MVFDERLWSDRAIVLLDPVGIGQSCLGDSCISSVNWMHHNTSLPRDAGLESQVSVPAIVGRGINRKIKEQVDKPSNGEWTEVDIL